MVAEVRPEHPSDWPAICAVAAKLGIGSAETLRKWVRQAEVDDEKRPRVSSEESAELRKLRAEVRELQRTNEIPQDGLGFLRVNAKIMTARRGSYLRCGSVVGRRVRYYDIEFLVWPDAFSHRS
jgi:transposase